MTEVTTNISVITINVNGRIAFKNLFDLQKSYRFYKFMLGLKSFAEETFYYLKNKYIHDVLLTKKGRPSASMILLYKVMYISVSNVS